jgi:hypothetical protein
MGDVKIKIEDIRPVTCATCDILIWLPKGYIYKRKGDHKSFYCPSGHMMYFPNPTDAEYQTRMLRASMQREETLRAQLKKNMPGKDVFDRLNARLLGFLGR